MPYWGFWLVLMLGVPVAADPGVDPCSQRPTAGPSRSVGRPASGRLQGAVAFVDSPNARVLPRRHRARCLSFGVSRLVTAIEQAARAVRTEFPGAPPLGVGDLSAARGGPIAWSHSHQAGRDVDLAFYVLDETGRPVATEDLDVHFAADGRGGSVSFDAPRTWALVKALVEDPTIELQWLFISEPLRRLLLAEAERQHVARTTLSRAQDLLHQPSDAPAHDDHLHVRIRCSSDERRSGCHD